MDLNLLDYIALDYKAPKYKFEDITHSQISKFDTFEQTLNYLIKSDISFEVRTTIHRDLLNETDINFIINDLYNKDYQGVYFLQNYLDTDSTIGNIDPQSKLLDLNIIQDKNDKITIKYRNFS